jgi:hypothetical protein
MGGTGSKAAHSCARRPRSGLDLETRVVSHSNTLPEKKGEGGSHQLTQEKNKKKRDAQKKKHNNSATLHSYLNVAPTYSH